MKRKLAVAIAVLTMLSVLTLAIGSDTDACTGFYMGSEVTESGNTMIGQSDDDYPYNPSFYTVIEASDKPGRTIEGIHGFVYELPDSTHKYVCHMVASEEGIASLGSGSTNDAGVAFTGSITIAINEAALEADPLVPDGLGEDTAARIVGSCASSAREAVEIIKSILDTKGSAENNTFLFADQKEAWYMEIYTAHQYCAIKLPSDKAAVFGNETCLVHMSDYPDAEFICSEELLTLPVEKGFAVIDEEGMNLMKTYAVPIRDYGHMRTWYGHQIFAPMEYQDDYDVNRVYEFLFTPEYKVTVKDIMDFARNRYEGTPYCPDDTGELVRVAGVENTEEAHILEIDGDAPTDLCITRWFCMGPTVYGAYIPISGFVDKFYGPYTKIASVDRLDTTTAYGLYKQLNVICSEERFSDAGTDQEKDLASQGVKRYWSQLEYYYMDMWPQVMEKALKFYQESPDKAKEYLNTYAVGIEKDLYEETKMIYEQTLLGIASTATTKVQRQAFEPMVDVSIYAKRYGWSTEITYSGMTLTNGIDVVTISPSDYEYSDQGIIRIGNEARICKVHVVEDRYAVSTDNLDFITQKAPVLVDYEPLKEGGGSASYSEYLLPIIVIIVAILCLFAYRAHRSR